MLARFPALLLPLVSWGMDWPQYHGPFGDKSSSHAIPAHSHPWLNEKPIWKIETPLGFSSFSTDGRLAFTLVAEEDEDGLLREACLAIELATGERVWKHWLGLANYGHGGGNAGTNNNSGGDGPRSTPSIRKGKVWIYDSNMNLHCLAATTGERLWKIDVISDYEGRNITWKNASSPLLFEDLVLVGGGGPEQTFLAFDQESGQSIWKSGDEKATHSTPALAVLHGRVQAIFLCQSGLVSLDPRDGKELWRQSFPFKVSSAATPVTFENFVFCSAGYGVGSGVYEIEVENGVFVSKEVWRKRNELMAHWSTPLCHNGYLYGMFGFKEYGAAPLQCIELKTGEIIWSKEGYGPGNLILAGKTLLALTDDGQLVTVAPTPDAYLEFNRRRALSGKCWSTPIVANGFALARSTKEAVCFKLPRLHALP